MRYMLLILCCLSGCGDASVTAPPEPSGAAVIVTVNPVVVSDAPVRLEIEKKPVKSIEVNLNKYEYKYSDDDEKPGRDVRDSKDKSKEKDG